MLLLIGILGFFGIVNADPSCPFQSCSSTYYSTGCKIYCDSKQFPDVGPINFDKIEYLTFKNLENIPKNAFQGLNIVELKINSRNLIQVDESAFDNVGKIDILDLDGIKNLSLFFENNSLKAISNMTKHLHISNAGLDNKSVIPIIDKLKYWTRLWCLVISNNNFSNFSYDFTNFTSLYNLGLINNFIETFDIKSNRLNNLNLYNNKITKLEKDMFVYLPNLESLRIDSNKISKILNDSFHSTKSLITIDLENNKIDYIEPDSFCDLKFIYSLLLSGNNLRNISLHCIDNVRYLYLNSVQYQGSIHFSFYPNLKFLTLKNNKLMYIDKDSFSKLPNLEKLYLGSNLISRIDPKAFANNTNLELLELRGNILTTTPDISELKYLNELDLYNNNITSLPNHAFERKLNKSNPLKSNIKIDLRQNKINHFTNKTFCSQYASSLGFLGFELQMDDINQMDKCMLRQFNSDKVKIVSDVKPSCEHLLMAKQLNIELNGNASFCEDLQVDLDKECYSNSKFKCSKGDELVRYTTWITGVSHIFSFKNKYELCSIGENALCFQYRNFKILCSDFYAGGSDLQATVLTSLKFVYQVSDSEQVSYEANRTSFPNTFNNGLLNIYDDKNPNIKLAKLIITEDSTNVIYIPNSDVHIFFSKWNSFYSIYIRTTNETYSESSGLLYEGCPIENNLPSRKEREISEECVSECSNIEFSIKEENMSEDIIRDACLFDCNEIGIESTSMIKTMVKKIQALILSDNYPYLVFPFSETTTKNNFEETTFFTTYLSTTTNSIITDNLITENEIFLEYTDLTYSESRETENTITPNDVTSSNQVSTSIFFETTTFITDIKNPTTEIAAILSTIENFVSNSSLSESLQTSISLSTKMSTTRTQMSKRPLPYFTPNQITNKISDENKLSFSLGEAIIFSSACVFLVFSVILLMIVFRQKKKTRVDKIDETELKRLRN
ncbi:unnamed protein product [Brachionus calyciflorus]|uniref:Uncharacterized protein n=1 Tax=Brachionus calyciflorus TaxID=104777 RepID=A0A813XVP1_9BILA|nr:unnamed protein product [Brachionus calyciflorus]